CRPTVRERLERYVSSEMCPQKYVIRNVSSEMCPQKCVLRHVCYVTRRSIFQDGRAKKSSRE
ncbi:hypothetical protein BgiBS90_019979, partial [Biomphalaria glabrata]